MELTNRRRSRCTGPGSEAHPFRRTEQAILQILDSARQRITLVSYAVYRIPNVRDALVRAATRGVHITVLVETPNRHANDVLVVREAVRAIVLDRDHRVLLFKAFPDNTGSRYFWITPGGGVATGESASTALRRELTKNAASS